MDHRRARQIINEFNRRFSAAEIREIEQQGGIEINLDADLFQKQLDLIFDPSDRKAVLAGRRGGKSVAIAYYLIYTCLKRPRSRCAFVGLTRTSAKKIIWDTLLDIIERYNINITQHLHDLTLTFSNGSKIMLAGADTEKEIRKFRGQYFELVCIDECGEFGKTLDYLIRHVLKQTLFDYGGTMVLAGTPGKAPLGFWWEVSTGQNPTWSLHTDWTLLDNEYMPRWRGQKNWREQAEEALRKEMVESGWNESSPGFIREYLGEWVQGNDLLVYSEFNALDNTYERLPPHVEDWNYILSVDFGIVDPSAMLLGAWSPSDPHLYIIEEWKEADLGVEEVANKVISYTHKYPNLHIVADGNGLGKPFVMQIQKMYSLGVNLAEKRNKVSFVELLNDQFKQNKIKVNRECKGLMEELADYTWANRVEMELPRIAEDHYCDALLYMFRYSAHWSGVVPKPKPKRDEKEWMDEIIRKEEERIINQQNLDWWESLDSGIEIPF